VFQEPLGRRPAVLLLDSVLRVGHGFFAEPRHQESGLWSSLKALGLTKLARGGFMVSLGPPPGWAPSPKAPRGLGSGNSDTILPRSGCAAVAPGEDWRTEGTVLMGLDLLRNVIGGGAEDAAAVEGETAKPQTEAKESTGEAQTEARDDDGERTAAEAQTQCPVPLTVRGTQALVGFAPLAPSVFCAARQNAVLRRSPLRPT